MRIPRPRFHPTPGDPGTPYGGLPGAHRWRQRDECVDLVLSGHRHVPYVIVCLGATAGRTLVGPSFRVSKDHGRFVDSPLAPHVTATLHPSAILRRPSDAERRQEMRRFVADLRGVAKVLAKG